VLKYSTDRSVKFLVDKLEWIIVPVVNVDGYIYSHTTVSSILDPGHLGQDLAGQIEGSSRVVVLYSW